MKNVAVANPKAAAGRVRTWWASHRAAIEERLGPVQVCFTTGPGDATRLTREAIAGGCERVLAVGGDGTVNEVVNGFFDEDGEAIGKGGAAKGAVDEGPTLVVYPGGTGGDFVRSIGLSEVDVIAALDRAVQRPIDVGRATYSRADGAIETRHFINISSFGSSGLIVDKVNKSTKRFGGKASFFLGTVKGLVQYKNQRVRLRVDEHEEELKINTVAVANGRYFGGSMMIAPKAILDDGMLDVVVIGDVGLATFVRYSGDIYKGKHLHLPAIRTFRGRRIEAVPVGKDPVLIDLDGEQPGQLPVTYEVLHKAIKILAPWQHAEAVER
ncbi:MAG: hypothetical protein A2289_23155 [Deltaproteobacteria bacterium RIFOXYA12_FULL_58_15]|nr:MAG: hypothetical protein A2289_23155 [Deltaproteobacteria bacterium RIFOXYA12_FULL_58_15]OGR08303.1 MAG: hypothetical protein A2341_05745 [Deltaproteobacteria bacterium RIFOXYB12_FULL_58_9]